MTSNLSLSGQVRCQVVNHDGSLALETPWQGNLLLDAGMNKLAEMPIADIFKVGIIGTDLTETSETPAGSNTYTQSGVTVTKTAVGGREFTANDVGKRIIFANLKEATILSYTSPTAVDTDTSQTIAAPNTIKFYHVHQIKLAEMLVAFAEGAAVNLSKAGASTTVTSDAPFFTIGQVGYAIYFPSQAKAFLIATYNTSTSVTISIEGGDDFTAVDEPDCAVFVPVSTSDLTSISRSSTYGTGVGDNGSVNTGATTSPVAPDYIKEMTRTIIFPPVPFDQTINEIGFSDRLEVGYNANIRVKLLSSVAVLGPVGLVPGQQLRLQYTLKVALSKVVSTEAACPITDPTNAMSTNKLGQYATESIMLSGVSSDGETESGAPILDPYYAPMAAIGPNFDALDPLNDPIRDQGFMVETTMETYVAGSFKTVFVAFWGINDAIADNHRTIMLYHEASDTPAWTWRFRNGSPQRKDNLHSLTIRFQKTWTRVLSA